jgi:hypothetical protein
MRLAVDATDEEQMLRTAVFDIAASFAPSCGMHWGSAAF